MKKDTPSVIQPTDSLKSAEEFASKAISNNFRMLRRDQVIALMSVFADQLLSLSGALPSQPECTCPEKVWTADGADMNESTCEINHEAAALPTQEGPAPRTRSHDEYMKTEHPRIAAILDEWDIELRHSWEQGRDAGANLLWDEMKHSAYAAELHSAISALTYPGMSSDPKKEIKK